MWIKTENNQYLDLNSGTVLFVSRYHEAVNHAAQNVELYRVQVESRNYAPKTLSSGYVDEVAAQDALDELMSGEEFKEIQPPVTEEETETESDVDSEEGK